MPETGSVRCPNDRLPPQLGEPTSVEPSGFRIEKLYAYGPKQKPGIVLLDVDAVTTWPAVPVNVRRAFCPGAVIDTGTPPPFGTIGPVMSTTEYTLTVALPVCH